ncbi:MAG: hypothetical protein HRT34_09735 [Alcanivorax sp.]|nr:hypothetical protein [Alcanivorax sp.]
MAAGQRDIPVLLQPGNGATVRAPGEFLYLKFADREIQAIVTGRDGTQSRVKMVTGDFTAPGGGIDEIELINPDTTTPCAVVITVGDGEFDRKIIQGEVTITPGIRGADGQFVDDTRSTVRVRVALGNITPQSYTAGNLIRVPGGAPDELARVTVLDNKRLLFSDSDGDGWTLVDDWPDSLAGQPIVGLGHGCGTLVGTELWVPEGQNLPVQGKRVVFNVYDAATLSPRRMVVTDIVWDGIPVNPQVAWAAYLPASDAVAVWAKDVNNDYFHFVGRDGARKRSSLKQGSGGNRGRNGAVLRQGVLHALNSPNNNNGDCAVFDEKTLQELDWDTANKLPDISMNSGGAALTPRDTLLLTDTYTYAEYPMAVKEFAITDVTISASGSVTSCRRFFRRRSTGCVRSCFCSSRCLFFR